MLTIKNRMNRRTRFRKALELNLIRMKAFIELFSNNPGIFIAIKEASTTGIRIYKLFNAESRLPNISINMNPTIPKKRNIYGSVRACAKINAEEYPRSLI